VRVFTNERRAVIITYQQVFSVTNIGDELRDGQGVNFTPCPAVKALRQILSGHSFFGGGKVQGTGPLYRPWDRNLHEFNRHHAGLAVDIMLNQGSASEVALGQQLVLLFRRHVGTMRWRSIIYQNVTFSPGGGATNGGDHRDHIHIDWHDSNNVQWHNGITSVPLRKSNGTVINLPLVQGNKIAKSIQWTAEALTDFTGAAALKSELADLMGKHSRGELTKTTWDAASLSGGPTSLNTIYLQLPGRWTVAIGNWTGLFFFDGKGGVSWAESDYSTKHAGRWSVNGRQLEWKFRDPGDFRTFTVPLPLNTGRVSGTILPSGQGWFTMSKASVGNVA
jgi:hypothetical protein